MPDYLVYVLDAEAHIAHCHTIMALSDHAIIRKVASLYRSHPKTEIRTGHRTVARLTAAEMLAIDSSYMD